MARFHKSQAVLDGALPGILAYTREDGKSHTTQCLPIGSGAAGECRRLKLVTAGGASTEVIRRSLWAAMQVTVTELRRARTGLEAFLGGVVECGMRRRGAGTVGNCRMR